MADYQTIYNIHASQTGLWAKAHVALSKFAAYTLSLNATQADVDWAKETLSSIESKVNSFFWEFCSDPAVMDAVDPNAITDSQVQTIVETICRKY